MNTTNEGFVGDLNQEPFAEPTTTGPINAETGTSETPKRKSRVNPIAPILRNIKDALAKMQEAQDALNDLGLDLQGDISPEDVLRAGNDLTSAIVNAWGERAAKLAKQEAMAMVTGEES